MAGRRGRRVALASAVLGAATLALSAASLKEFFLEQVYIHRLKSREPADRESAVTRLGEMR